MDEYERIIRGIFEHVCVISTYQPGSEAESGVAHKYWRKDGYDATISVRIVKGHIVIMRNWNMKGMINIEGGQWTWTYDLVDPKSIPDAQDKIVELINIIRKNIGL